MELNKVEIAEVQQATREVADAAIKELVDLQLILVGGGAEVSFN